MVCDQAVNILPLQFCFGPDIDAVPPGCAGHEPLHLNGSGGGVLEY